LRRRHPRARPEGAFPATQLIILPVVIDDADAAHAELAARGVPVSAVQDLPSGRFVYFADPDGNRVSG